MEVPPFLFCRLPASQDKQNLLVDAELPLTVWKPKGKQKHNCAHYSLNTRVVNKECKESKENGEHGHCTADRRVGLFRVQGLTGSLVCLSG